MNLIKNLKNKVAEMAEESGIQLDELVQTDYEQMAVMLNQAYFFNTNKITGSELRTLKALRTYLDHLIGERENQQLYEYEEKPIDDDPFSQKNLNYKE